MPAGATLVVTGKRTGRRSAASCRRCRTPTWCWRANRRTPAAAIGLAAAILYRRDPETIMGSFAADQVISPDRAFQDAVREAIHTAAAGKIVTIGIKPDPPVHRVRLHPLRRDTARPRRAERPGRGGVRGEARTRTVAQQYLSTAANMSGTRACSWRRWRCMLKHLEANQPELFAGLHGDRRGLGHPGARRGHGPGLARRCPRSPSTTRWPSLPRPPGDVADGPRILLAGTTSGTSPPSGRLNTAKEVDEVTVLGDGARVFTENASGVVVSDTKRVIALIGIKDVVMVDTPDALLVTTKEHAQRVKQPWSPQGQRRHRRPVAERDAGQMTKVTSRRRCPAHVLSRPARKSLECKCAEDFRNSTANLNVGVWASPLLAELRHFRRDLHRIRSCRTRNSSPRRSSRRD